MTIDKAERLIASKSGTPIYIDDVNEHTYRLQDGSIMVLEKDGKFPVGFRYRNLEVLKEVYRRAQTPYPENVTDDSRGPTFNSPEALDSMIDRAYEEIEESEGVDLRSEDPWRGIRRLSAYIRKSEERYGRGDLSPGFNAGFVFGDLLCKAGIAKRRYQREDGKYFFIVELASGRLVHPTVVVFGLFEAGRRDLVRYAKIFQND